MTEYMNILKNQMLYIQESSWTNISFFMSVFMAKFKYYNIGFQILERSGSSYLNGL